MKEINGNYIEEEINTKTLGLRRGIEWEKPSKISLKEYNGNDLSHRIIKNVPIPRISRAYRNKVVRKLTEEQKKDYQECKNALEMMKNGQSIIIRDWQIMTMILGYTLRKDIKIIYKFLSKESYHIWKIDKKEIKARASTRHTF